MHGTVIPRLTPAEIAAFWAQTRRVGLCLEWSGSLNGPRPSSYGLFTIRRSGQRIRLMAHRVALAITSRHDGFFACHHCDNPPCVDPQHLYWGTPKSNTADAIRRGRSRTALPGVPRPDVTRRLVADLRARGSEVASITSGDLADWRELDAIAAHDGLDRYAERLSHGARLPDWIA